MRVREMSQKMIQPNPDEPCQWCGAVEHKQPIICYGQKECPHCGGIHWGSYYCPYSETQVEKENKMEGAASRQMPKYKSHKEVWALKIAAIEMNDDGSMKITPADPGYGQFTVEKQFVPTHDPARPQVGWYFVQYQNGYKSFSPADAFEEGYTAP